MRGLKYLALTLAAGLFLIVPSPSRAQVSFGINIGPEPVCPYGFYDYAPYACAPYGYYGPEWFNGGVFLGAGPWFHGPRNFYGHVNNHFDMHHGYHGALPKRGERAPSNFHGTRGNDFHGNEMRDGRGHTRAGSGKR